MDDAGNADGNKNGINGNANSNPNGNPNDQIEQSDSNSEPIPKDYISNLPIDILDDICQKLPSCVPLLFVSRKWFVISCRYVYASPHLISSNFSPFLQTLTENKILGPLVRELNLVSIAQIGKNSMLSKLLHKCSINLRLFVAPQSHFGYAPMISLSHCTHLEVLDLSLVSEKIDLAKLFKIICKFKELRVLYFPRSSLACTAELDEDANSSMEWPPNLMRLGLSGGFPSHFIETTNFPKTITDLQITNCPYLTRQSFNHLLSKMGPQLKKLAVLYPLALLNEDALDYVFLMCPNLKSLQVSVDYLTDEALDPTRTPLNHPLTTLSLYSSGLMGHSDKIRPGDILLATDYFLNLKVVQASLLLGWKPESSTLMGLVEVLYERGGGVWYS